MSQRKNPAYADGGDVEPEGLDQFIASDPSDMDPQSQVASQGMKQIANTAPVQQALDFGGNLDRYSQTLKAASPQINGNVMTPGDADANLSLAQHSLGTAMSSLKELPEGFTVKHGSGANSGGIPTHVVTILDHKGNEIARSEFEQVGNNWEPQYTSVDPKYRRHGLANNLYASVEEKTGQTIRPSQDQTSAGRGLWHQNERPFGWDMSKTDEGSRLARADNMGFDTTKTYYHGTNKDFDSFNDYGNGIWVAETPEKAKEFAFDEGANIIPAHIKTKNPLVITKENEHLYSKYPTSVLQGYAKEQGHDAIIYPDRGTVNILDKNNIKSKFSKFNPKQAKSGKLSYSDGGNVDPSDLDPQSAVAANGYRQMLDSGPAISKAPMEGVEPEGSPIDLVAGGVGSKLGSEMASDAGSIIGNEFGVLGNTPKFTAAETLSERQPSGLIQRAKDLFPHATDTKSLYQAAEDNLGVAHPITKAIRQGMQTKKYADGGVTGDLTTGDVMFADGGMAEPPGLDQFINSPESQPTVVNQPQNQTEPEGLDQFLSSSADEEKYGTPSQMALAAGEGAARGLLSPPVATGLEVASGLTTGEDIRGRQETNPWTAGASELAGFAAPAILTGGMSAEAQGLARFTQSGGLQAVGKLLEGAGLKAGESLASKVGVGAAKIAIDSAILSAGDEVSKMITQDPNQSAESAIAHVGLSAGIGAVFGGGGAGIAGLWEAKLGPKVSEFLQDFKSAAIENAKYPDKAEAVSSELSQLHSALTTAVDPLPGASLKESVPSLAAFERKFMADNGVKKILDPADIGTLLKQVGKPQASVKSEIVNNFIDESTKYLNEINRVRKNINLEPVEIPGLSATKMLLNDKPTLGAKAFNYVFNKGLEKSGSETLATIVGGGLGHASGIPGGGILGAILGEHALAPFFSTTLPALAKPILENTTNSSAFKSALDHAINVAGGSMDVSKASKYVFSELTNKASGALTAPEDRHVQKLDKQLKEFRDNPDMINSARSPAGSYLPAHNTAMGQSTGNAITYLNSQRPNEAKQSPLDSKPMVNPVQKATYESALKIAQKPLSIVEKIKSGSINPNDMKHLMTLYPELYKSLSANIMNSMTDHVSKGKEIPYRTKLGVSLFLGQPMDSSMTPASIIAAQPKPVAPPQAGGPPAKKQSKSAPLSKYSSPYMTPDQSRMSREKEGG